MMRVWTRTSIVRLLLRVVVVFVAAVCATEVDGGEVEGTDAHGDATTLDRDYDAAVIRHLELFRYSPDAQVMGPSAFPRPTGPDESIVPDLQPVHGRHRPDVDAVVAFAAEYPLSNYVSFIESLRQTGFDGDVVLAISPLDMRKDDVMSYLTEPGNHVILYAPVLVCYNAEQEAVESAKGGMRTCTSDHLYARKSGDDRATPLPDPRPPRTVQTLRYEIYWLMTLPIAAHAWILLVDARDTVFQANPFAHVPRRTDPSARSGVLYLFGENADATRLGRSRSNRKWLEAAYGQHVAALLADKPTICSGATMGEQIAMRTYIQAMIAESDDTGVVLAGADQGFHNYLHYSHKLKNADTIHSIVVFDQGQGIVNNMGALRTQPLDKWGNGKIVTTAINANESNPQKQVLYTVRNWDGTVSPVVHQFDRHKHLSDYFIKFLGGKHMDAWQERKQRLR